MATTPNFPSLPLVWWSQNNILTANTAMDGTGTVEILNGTVPANGGRASRLLIRHRGTNVTTALRLFINNGATNATASNNTFVGDYTIGASTLSQTSAMQPYDFPLGFDIPSGYRFMITIGTALAAGLSATIFGTSN